MIQICQKDQVIDVLYACQSTVVATKTVRKAVFVGNYVAGCLGQ